MTEPHAPFTPPERAAFIEAMRKLYDQATPMLVREHLIRIGENIAARQGVDLEGLRADHG